MHWPWSPVPGREPLNFWNFPSVWSVFVIPDGPLGPHLIVYDNKVTYRKAAKTQ